jgi:putative sigma-54 modulation protein
MKVNWTARHLHLAPSQQTQIEDEFRRVGKILDNGAGEAEAHVMLAHEHDENHVEIKVAYHRHELLGQASGSDLFACLHVAVEKIEKQAIKLREKWRDDHRKADNHLPDTQ